MLKIGKKRLLEPPKIVVCGGGTGSFTLLQDLKRITPHITALITMCDDGGSTGRLRDELGVLPAGDVRQCLVALSNAPEIRDIFGYRFGEGSLAGQSLGNIILAGLELQYDFRKAIKVASSVLNITGQVIPITTDKHTLVLHDGRRTIRGQFEIDQSVLRTADPKLELEPAAVMNPDAAAALAAADLIVLAPGSLYGSLLSLLAVNGVPEAIRAAKAPKIVVSNLVTKPGQTDGWHAVDYIHRFERELGKGTIDMVLYNNRPPSTYLLKKYAAAGEFPVAFDDERFKEIKARSIGGNVVAGHVFPAPVNDVAVRRTFIRHDGAEVGRLIMQYWRKLKR
ncbi:MAG: gluconeogenesis factor YvcK family protein [Patescibacteria group bacterium]